MQLCGPPEDWSSDLGDRSCSGYGTTLLPTVSWVAGLLAFCVDTPCYVKYADPLTPPNHFGVRQITWHTWSVWLCERFS